MIQNSFTSAVDTKTLEFQSQFEDNGWKYLRWKTTQKELGHCPWRPPDQPDQLWPILKLSIQRRPNPPAGMIYAKGGIKSDQNKVPKSPRVEEDRIHGDLYGGIKTWRIRSLTGFCRLCLKKRRVGISSARKERQKIENKEKTKQTALLWAGLIPVMVG